MNGSDSGSSVPAPRAGKTQVAPPSDDLSRRIVSESRVVFNIHQRYIIIPRDRLKLVIQENRPRLVRTEVLINVSALFLGLLLAMLTANFQDRWKVNGEQWQAGFFVATVMVGAWLGYETFRFFFRRLSVEGLVIAIESQSDERDD